MGWRAGRRAEGCEGRAGGPACGWVRDSAGQGVSGGWVGGWVGGCGAGGHSSAPSLQPKAFPELPSLPRHLPWARPGASGRSVRSLLGDAAVHGAVEAQQAQHGLGRLPRVHQLLGPAGEGGAWWASTEWLQSKRRNSAPLNTGPVGPVRPGQDALAALPALFSPATSGALCLLLLLCKLPPPCCSPSRQQEGGYAQPHQAL